MKKRRRAKREESDEPTFDPTDDDADGDAADEGESDDEYLDYSEDEDGGGDGRRPIWLNPLVLTSTVLVLLLGGLIGWLALSYQPAEPETVLSAVVTLDPPPPPPAMAAVPQPVPAGGATPEAGDAPAETGEGNVVAASDEDDSFFEDDDDAPPATASARPGESGETTVAALPEEPTVAPPALTEEDIKLAPVPDPALIATGNNGPVPVIAPDGRQAWQVYARPFAADEPRPRIAILLAGLGLSQSATSTAIQQLPGPVTLGFTPYAPRLGDWIGEARAAGHEVFLELPMEPFDYPASDPGPHTLLTSLTPEDNLARLDWLLSRFAGYVGVTNFLGDKFTSSPDSLEPVLADLRDRGLMFLDARTSRNSVAAQVAVEIDLPRAVNNRFLDNEASRVSIDARLFELEQIAKNVGFAVGVGFPYPVTLERLARWAPTLAEKGLVLAPISALANLQTQ